MPLSRAVGIARELPHHLAGRAYLDVHASVASRSAPPVILTGPSLEQVVAATASEVIGSSSAAEFVRPSASKEFVAPADPAKEIAATSALYVIGVGASDDDVVASRPNKE
jgi:hypothetical protein